MQYVDDPTVLDLDFLWRRIPWVWCIFDENMGAMRPTSQAFHDSENGHPMSVLLAKVMLEKGRGSNDALQGLERFALASLTARSVRDLKQGIARDPLLEEPAHAVVFGEKKKSVSKKMAKLAQWLVPPPLRKS